MNRLAGKPHRPISALSILGFLTAAIVILAGFSVLTQFSNTLVQLDSVEAERDRWQRPADVINALAIGPGAAVVDLGSGAGYFALRLSPVVGPNGQVTAVDLRRLSLLFLRVRAWTRHLGNIRIVAGAGETLDLPPGTVDAVLIANTYHEFTNRNEILGRVLRMLRAGGRVVIVDRGPRGAGSSGELPEHQIAASVVEAELRDSGFRVLTCDERFIEGDEPWWLLAARRP